MNPNKLIDELGGTSAVARLCEVKPPSVSDWRRYGIPKARLMFLRAIRPDLFHLLAQPNELGKKNVPIRKIKRK